MLSDEIHSRQVRPSKRAACRRCTTHLSRICRRRFGLISVIVTVVLLLITTISVLRMAGNY